MKLPDSIVSDYKKEGKYRFPRGEQTEPNKKSKDYLLGVAESIFHEFVMNRTGIYYNLYPIWEDNRLYGSEQQFKYQYKRTYQTGDNTSTVTTTDALENQFDELQRKRRGEISIDYNIISLAKRIKDTVHGMFDEKDWDISINVIDAVHKYEEKYQKFKLFSEVLFGEYFQKWRKQANIPQPNQKFLPKSEQELDAFAANGGFKLNQAISLEKLLKHTFEISKWDDVKYKFVDDALDLGVVGAKEYYDPESESIKMRYADPTRCGVQFSEQYDFEDSDYAFEIKMYPLSKLLQYGFEEKELKAAAKRYNGEFNNPTKGDWGRYDFNQTNDHHFEFFQVPVMEFEFIDTDCEYQNVRKDQFGRDRISVGEFGKVVNGENEKTRVFKYRKKYEGKWVIGTKLIFDYGASKQQYKKNRKPRLSWKFVKVTDKPIIERLKPIFDDMMHAWVRYQKASILAANSGYAINARLLQNIQMGGDDYSPDKVLQFMRETGYLLYSDTEADGQYRGGEVRPVHEIPGGMKQVLEDSINRFNMAVQMVEQVTGLNLIAMGASPTPDTGKGVTEMSMMATNNTIRPYEHGVRKLKKAIAEGLAEKIRLFVRVSPEIATRTYTKVVGIKDLYSLKIADDTNVEYGLSFEPRATDAERAEILRSAEIALQPGKDGVSQIKFSDWLNIKQMLSVETNLKLMNQILAYQIEKYEEMNVQRAREAQEIEQQKNIQLTQMKIQEEERKDARQLQKETTISDRNTLNKIKEINAQGVVDEKLLDKELEFRKQDETLNYYQSKGGKK